MDMSRECRDFEAAKAQRQPHEWVWRDCCDHSFTLRGSGLQQSNSMTASEASDRKARIVDSTATDAGTVLASALQSGGTPANSRWQGLEVNNADDEGKRWLDESSEQLHQEIHNSNFDSISLDCNLDMVAIGWFVQFIDAAPEGGLVFEDWPVSQCYPASSRAAGPVDIIRRFYQITAMQAVEFARRKGGQVSEQTQKKSIDEPEAMIDMLHVIKPRAIYVPGSKRSKTMPFESCHVEYQTKHLVLESGFEEFPCVVPRWSRIPDTPYAVGPMFNVLPDVREINELKRLDKAASEIAVMGMWKAKDDGILNPRTIKVGARKVIPVADIENLQPLTTGANWMLADKRIEQLQAAIRKGLMADQLQPQGSPVQTATEIQARIALMRQQLGPLFGRMQAEYLQGLVTRCFMLMFRAGRFGPPPRSLENKAFTVRFISPLAKSQKLEEVTAIQSFNAWAIGVSEVRPDVLDNIDFDDQAKSMAEGLGVPLSGIRTSDERAAIRTAKQQQQAAQAQQEHQQQITTMAADATFKGMAKAA